MPVTSDEGLKPPNGPRIPRDKKTATLLLAVFLLLCVVFVSVEIAGRFLGLIHPHRLLAGFRPDAVQIAIKTRTIFPEQHHRQSQHASHYGESAAHEHDMSRKLFIKSIFFSPIVGRKRYPENSKSVTWLK